MSYLVNAVHKVCFAISMFLSIDNIGNSQSLKAFLSIFKISHNEDNSNDEPHDR